VLAGSYTDVTVARRDAARLRAANPSVSPRVIGAALASGLVATVANDLDLLPGTTR
jgi:hypothetical protein